jgi:segregation and condensation protein B
LETLALIAYRQPITRAEIEEVRGVSVSSTIIKTLQEREWVRVVGHRDVPGKPAMYATTRDFLDYFNLQSLDELPTLAEIRDIDNINAELAFDEAEGQAPVAEPEAADTGADESEATPELEGMEATDVAGPEEAQLVAAEAEPEMEDEEEAFLSDEALKAIDALNLSLRENIHGHPAEEEEQDPEAEALAREERELESDLEGEAKAQEEQDKPL